MMVLLSASLDTMTIISKKTIYRQQYIAHYLVYKIPTSLNNRVSGW